MSKILLGLFLFLLIVPLVVGWALQRQFKKACPPQGGFVQVNDHKIHYIEREGAGTVPVVMLHGASSSSVDYQMSLFESVPDKYRLIAIDRPGLAHSERKFKKFEALQGQLEVLNQAIGKLTDGPVYLITHSLSGVIGARLLSDFPDKYKGMLGVAPALYPIGDGKSWYSVLADVPVLGWYFRNALVPIAGQFIAPGLIEKNFSPNPVPKDYMKDSCLKLMFESERFKNNAHDLNLVRPYLDESYERYQAIDQPVSLVFGREDKILATFSHSYGFRHKVPHVDIHILDDTGHLPHHFQIDLINSLLDKLTGIQGSKESGLQNKRLDDTL